MDLFPHWLFFFFFSSLAYIYFFLTLAPWHKLPNNSLASEDKICLVCFSHNWFSHLIRSPWGEITRHQNKLLTTKQLIALMPVSLVTKMSEEVDTCSLRDIDYSLHQQCKGQCSISELHNTIKTSTSSLSLWATWSMKCGQTNQNTWPAFTMKINGSE